MRMVKSLSSFNTEYNRMTHLHTSSSVVLPFRTASASVRKRIAGEIHNKIQCITTGTSSLCSRHYNFSTNRQKSATTLSNLELLSELP